MKIVHLVGLEEERRNYIINMYPCIADCDMCGLCTVFHGKDPELAYDDYILGKCSFEEVNKKIIQRK